MSPLCLNSGLLYINKTGNLQQIRWLCAESSCSFLFDPKAAELEAALTIDWNRPHQVIAVLTKKKKDAVNSNSLDGLPPGYVLDIAPQTTGFIYDTLGKADTFIDNDTIWGLDLTKLNSLEQFPRIKELYDQSDPVLAARLVKAYNKYPTTLAKALQGGLGYETTLSKQEDSFYSNYLLALTSPTSTLTKWAQMSFSEAMPLFGSDEKNFLVWLSHPLNSHSALIPLLQPFITAFKRTLKIEYIHDFGRWIFVSRLYGKQERKLGAMSFINSSNGREYFYCDFSHKALIEWSKLVTSIELEL